MTEVQPDPADIPRPNITLNEEISTSSDISTAVSTSTDLHDQTLLTPTATATSDLRHRHPSTTTTTPSPAASTASQPPLRTDEFYECNICFDTATHPVLTLCGHLFCWTCLAQWLNAQARNPTCPVCKAGCGKDKVIPVYGRGREEKDPRKDPAIPTRPAGQRPPALRDPGYTTSFFGHPFRGLHRHQGTAGMTLSPTAGFFPFPFGLGLNVPLTSVTAPGIGGPGPEFQSPSETTFFSRLVLMLLTLFIATIIFY